MNATSASSSRRAFAVVPAAGRSARMGRPKLLLPSGAADGRRLIECVLAAWQAGGVVHRIVTVHPDDAELAAVCRAAGAEVVLPSTPPPDMKASVAAALEHVAARFAPQAGDVWLVAPADLPHLSPTVIAHLLQSAEAQTGRVLRPVHRGKHGHPLLLPWSARSELAAIPADRGLDELLERVPVVDVEAGAECLASDVDTPDDYRRLLDRYDRPDR